MLYSAGGDRRTPALSTSPDGTEILKERKKTRNSVCSAADSAPPPYTVPEDFYNLLRPYSLLLDYLLGEEQAILPEGIRELYG